MAEQMHPTLGLKNLTPWTLQRIVPPELRHQLRLEVLGGQVVSQLLTLIFLGLGFESTQLTHPGVGDKIHSSRCR